MDTFRLAWRNLGRNLRRTLATATALAFGISLCVASYGLVDGLSAQMVHSLTRLELGHLQVHDPEFAARKNVQATIAEPQPIVTSAKQLAHVQGVSVRAYAFGLVSAQGKSSAVELVGVDPKTEPSVTELDRMVTEGSYLDEAPTPWPEGRALTAEEKKRDAELSEEAEEDALAEIDALPSLEKGGADTEPAVNAAAPAPKRPDADLAEQTRELAKALSPPPERPLRVIIGSSLAKVLGAATGSELYVSTVALDGSVEAVFLEVAGIYQTGSSLFDRHRLYLHLDDLRRLGKMGKAAHEIAVTFEEPDQATPAAAQLEGSLGPSSTLLVRPWDVVRPDIKQMLQLNEVSTDLMVFIIFVVATLGVVNTMLMSVFERTRELGVLKAIGMSAGRVVALIVSETVFLVLCAALVGTLLGLGLDLYMVAYGVDLTSFTGGFSMAGVAVNPVIYGVVSVRGLVMPTMVLSIFCVLASLYPALRAARLEPAVGMRET